MCNKISNTITKKVILKKNKFLSFFSVSMLFVIFMPFVSAENTKLNKETEVQVNFDYSEEKNRDAKNGKKLIKKSGTRETIYKSAVDFAQWLDEFFAEDEGLESAGYDYLRLVNILAWRKGEGVDYHPRIRAKVNLPKMHKNLSLMFSDTNEIARGQFDEVQTEDFSAEKDNDNDNVSAAINYESEIYSRSKFDTRIGLDSSVELFAMLKHTYQIYKTDTISLRNFNYIFWKDKEHLGVNSRFELDKTIDDNSLFRWKYSILNSEKSEGNEWRNTFSYVEQFSNESWLSYDFDMFGVADRNYLVETYRLAIRYRFQLDIKWLYFEIEPEILWQRNLEFSERKVLPGLILRLEVQFEN